MARAFELPGPPRKDCKSQLLLAGALPGPPANRRTRKLYFVTQALDKSSLNFKPIKPK